MTKHDYGRQQSLLLVKLVEAAASLLSKALVVIEQGNDLCRVHSLWEGVYEVLAHMQTNVSTNQVTQPACTKAVAQDVKLRDGTIRRDSDVTRYDA